MIDDREYQIEKEIDIQILFRLKVEVYISVILNFVATCIWLKGKYWS